MVAYYCFVHLNRLPSEIVNLPDREINMIYAFIAHYKENTPTEVRAMKELSKFK